MGSNQRSDRPVVAITGAASGIGRATANEFAEDGASIVIADIDTDAGPEVAETLTTETSGHATFIEVDVTVEEDIEEMVATAVDEYGGLDVGINNAGVGSSGESVTDISRDEWQRVIDANLTGVWRCMVHEIEAMLEDGSGKIVNTASILGKVALENTADYTAAKHGVIGVTKTAALEYANDDILINAVCPGFTNTALLNASDTIDAEARKALAEEHPVGRLGEPEEIASGIKWLCSDGASFTTGETLTIDGGYLSH